MRLGSDESINHVLNALLNNVLGATGDIKYACFDPCPQRQAHTNIPIKIRESVWAKLLSPERYKTKSYERIGGVG